MPWGPGQSVTTDAISTNLGWLFVFGATDSGKNLVSGTSYSTSLVSSAAYGTDSIGTYVGNTTGGYLSIGTNVLTSPWPNADYSYFITFSREGSPGVFAGTFLWSNQGGGKDMGHQGNGSLGSQAFWSGGSTQSAALNLSTITASTEFTLVYVKTGTTAKVFYKSGGSSIGISGVNNTGYGSNIGLLTISGWQSGEFFPGRFRAYGRWQRALSDAEAQSMANNPQQILAAAATPIYEFQSFSRGVGRGIARGIA